MSSIIQAQPGWFLLFVNKDTGVLAVKTPIVSLEIVTNDENVAVNIITMTGRYVNNGEGIYVLRPDGVVELLGEVSWANLASANDSAECTRRLQRRGDRNIIYGR